MKKEREIAVFDGTSFSQRCNERKSRDDCLACNPFVLSSKQITFLHVTYGMCSPSGNSGRVQYNT